MGLFSKQTAITSQIDVIANLPAIKNWDEVVKLCETINAKEDGAKEAAKALRKKLRLGRPQQQMNAITLIQAMVDGCGSKFKVQLATLKFAEDIEAVVVADSTDANVKIRLMERLDEWAAVFATDPGLVIIPQLYHMLVKNNTPRSNNSHQNPPSPPRAPMTPEQRMRQMAQDIELARNSARMLTEAVSFTDPEMEAIEENELIKEFHSKCLTLQRGIQQYLSEMTESSTPNEQWLTALLSANQEIVQAFTAYNQMMESHHLNRITKASEMADVIPNRNGDSLSNGQFRPSNDLISFDNNNGAGVGLRHSNSNGTTTGNGKGVSSNHNGTSTATSQPTSNPFADEPYFVTGPADVASAVKMGKRTDNQDNKIFDASAFLKQQQLEQEQLQALKNEQKLLHEQEQQQRQQQSAAGSSQGASSAVSVSTHP
ncbi:putative actin patch assembly and actin polymerization protein [Modicella reniformis]|uniref:Actin patch assembly and actin polymerization protein n=1 Tax=Modicella reniformis TaxID=1440133 RepID=A0A9P6J9W4_9FUNG|nr:putative actin patch assembly and actin polymerization protein [Modicella reniformis]